MLTTELLIQRREISPPEANSVELFCRYVWLQEPGLNVR